MKILLLGKNGQLGQALQKHLSVLGSVVALGREELDLADSDQLLQKLLLLRPNILINAAAYTRVDDAEHFPDICYRTNAAALLVMANYAKEYNCLLVHYSTDYVFDGAQSTPYLETDSPNPLNVYGHSKRTGEDFILQSQCKSLIFRTSWCFSLYGNNFIKTILRLAMERDSLSVVNDQYGAPTSVELIAAVTVSMILKYNNQSITTTGLFHLTAGGQVTWYDFCVYIVKRIQMNGMKIKLDLKNIHPVSTHVYSLPAIRPLYSCLNTSKLSDVLNLSFLHWKIAVDQVIDQLTKVGM